MALAAMTVMVWAKLSNLRLGDIDVPKGFLGAQKLTGWMTLTLSRSPCARHGPTVRSGFNL